MIQNLIFKVRRKINKKSRKTLKKYKQPILSMEEFNEEISKKIISGEPFAVSRIGATEMDCIDAFRKKKKFNSRIKDMMKNNAGFFPIDSIMLEKFSVNYLTNIKEIDYFGFWKNTGEDEVLNSYAEFSKITDLKNIEPYYSSENPWSRNLKGKKVLVIHPFTESIESQYLKRELIHNENILPNFTLITLAPPQTIGGESEKFENWFEALNDTLEEIKNIDFDIALIGAGAYGLPIASFIKKELNKQAIHFGGSLQILFGIKGGRWDKDIIISKMYNSNWIRPSKNERPASFSRVEKGCYW